MNWEDGMMSSPLGINVDSNNQNVGDCDMELCSDGADMSLNTGDDDEHDSFSSDGEDNLESDTSPPPTLNADCLDFLYEGGDTIPLVNATVQTLPYVGLEFVDEDEAYTYYNMFAKEKGFSVGKGRVERSRSDKRILSRAFVCSNQGSKYSKDKRRIGKEYQPRVSKKTNCGAVMRVKPSNGKWVVDILVLDHNHDLVDPHESFRLRSHQKAHRSSVHLIERLQRCGITPSMIFRILKDFAGGEQHAGISDVRFKSMFRSKRRKSLGIDCQLAVNYLHQKRDLDPNFFFSVSVNKDEELIGIFWVDGRAREQYRKFGDVLVFDTTYRKNKYKFPFAPFTGVNHHMQCTLFGCGLIADETKESFEWLFKTWLQGMNNVHPKAILTDEDPGIMRAVKKVFPSTVHRLCAWHLEKHRQTHLGPLYRKFPELRQMFYTCVHNSSTPLEFENSWDNMLNTFNLHSHKWLKKKFKIRKHWVPCYFPDTFFAGMITTQRAESMNNYFKGYFSSSTPINEFITQYEEAVRKRRGIEAKADVMCVTTSPHCSTSHPLEMHAAEVYTHNVFNVFKHEWKVCLGVEIRNCVMEQSVKRYETLSSDIGHRNKVEYVIDNEGSDVTSCTCNMFEHTGVICRHILKVYVITDRHRIPEKYVLPRWTKAARYSAEDSSAAVGAPTSQPLQPVWVLNDMAHRLVSEASLSQERFGVAYQGLTNLLSDVLKLEAVGSLDASAHAGQQSTSTNATLNVVRALDPTNRSITRGRPNVSRLTSTFENVQHRRSYRCSSCGQPGHNVVKCPQLNTNNGGGVHGTTAQPLLIDLNDPPTQDQET